MILHFWCTTAKVYHLKRRIVIQQFCYPIFIRYLIAKIAWVAVIVVLYCGIKHPEETSGRTIPLEALKRIGGLKCHEPSNALSILAGSVLPFLSLSLFLLVSLFFSPSVSLWARKRGSNRVVWNWHSNKIAPDFYN